MKKNKKNKKKSFKRGLPYHPFWLGEGKHINTKRITRTYRKKAKPRKKWKE